MNCINEIKNLTLMAGEIAASNQGKNLDIEIKSDQSPVTNIDKQLSSLIVTKLQELTPGILIVSEEEEIPDLSGISTFWLIDPIDGTKSYIKGEDSYTVNIGLIENGVPTYGFIYQPSKKLLHYTDQNLKLVVERDGDDVSKLIGKNRDKGCIIAVSAHSSCPETRNFIKDNKAEEVVVVSSSIKLCLVADGSVDLYPRFGETMEWDIAAGHALVRASGGEVLDLSGRPMQYGKAGLLNRGFLACGSGYLGARLVL
jgi:3'(2'), 5'-bisphosphate nucleotidase